LIVFFIARQCIRLARGVSDLCDCILGPVIGTYYFSSYF
jgi:hypothetical protein